MLSRTPILLLIVLLAAGGTFLAFMRLDKARAAALGTERDATTVHKHLTEIARANSGGPKVAVGQVESTELTRRLTAAAVEAGVLAHLVDTVSGNPTRLENSEYSEQEMMLRFDKISLRQLAVFFDRLSATDPGSRVKIVELAPPDLLAGGTVAGSIPNLDDGQERWTAFVSVAYLMHAPKDAKGK